MANTNLVTNLNADLLDGLNGTRYSFVPSGRNSDALSTYSRTGVYGTTDSNPDKPPVPGGTVYNHIYSGQYGSQIFGGLSTNKWYARTSLNYTTGWGSWREFAFIDSNVASATKLRTARTIAGVSFDGTANIAIPFANLSSKPTTLGGYGITDAVTLNTAQTITGAKTFTASVTAPTFIGALNGNATTATTLATARTLTVGNTGKAFNGSANASWSLTEIGAASLSQSILAGNGLTGGGTLAADRTITLGTPSTLSNSTTNSVTATSHTHQITGFLPLTGGALTDILSIKSSSANLLTLERASTFNANMVFKTSTNSVFIGQGGNGQFNVGGEINLSDSANQWLSVDANSLIAHGVNGITAPSFNTPNWKIEQVGTELLLKYNNLIAARFLADGSIVGLGEITAYGATTGGEGVSLLRTGGTMTGNLTMAADIIMNSGRAIGVSNLPLKLLGNALTYNASNVLTEANTATQIKMGNGWTIEQTVASLTIRKDGVIKGTFNA
jgi:hypothetical protein